MWQQINRVLHSKELGKLPTVPDFLGLSRFFASDLKQYLTPSSMHKNYNEYSVFFIVDIQAKISNKWTTSIIKNVPGMYALNWHKCTETIESGGRHEDWRLWNCSYAYGIRCKGSTSWLGDGQVTSLIYRDMGWQRQPVITPGPISRSLTRPQKLRGYTID